MEFTRKFWEGHLKEIARDLIALGGIPFFILVIGRVWLLSKAYYQFQFIFGGIIFIAFMLLFKADVHAGLGIVILFFLTKYYNNLNFGIFASCAYLILLVSLVYLGKEKKEIFKGLLFGGIATAISYYIVQYIFF